MWGSLRLAPIILYVAITHHFVLTCRVFNFSVCCTLILLAEAADMLVTIHIQCTIVGTCCNMMYFILYLILCVVGETFIGPTSSSVRILSNSTGINCADIALIGNSVIERTRVFTVTWSLVDDFNGRVTLSRANTSISVTDDG